MHRENYPATALGTGLFQGRAPVFGSALHAPHLLLGEGMQIADQIGQKVRA
jgi:hypothetical protein